MNKNHEKRTDCEYFQAKEFEHQCGDCQTDGHYLCEGCKHIASFDDMELSDNRMRYYGKQEKESIEAEKLLLEETNDDEMYGEDYEDKQREADGIVNEFDEW